MAMHPSPTAMASESPTATCESPSASIFSSATSLSESPPTISAGYVLPSCSLTDTLSVLSTTWLFVTTYPSSVSTNPLPTTAVDVVCPNTFVVTSVAMPHTASTLML